MTTPTEEQRKFLHTSAKVVFLDAIPGAGKTTLIQQKIISLLNKKPKKHKTILYLAFNVKLVEEAKAKFAKTKQFNRHVQVLTIHALFLKFIRRHIKEKFIIVENHSSITKAVNIKYLTFNDIEHVIETNILDFKHWLESLYDHIFIDEVQDLKESIANIFLNLIKLHIDINIYFVGDLNQMIYQFNNVNHETIMKLKNNATKIITLSNTFRLGQNTTNILSLMFNKKLHSKSPQQDIIQFINFTQPKSVLHYIRLILTRWTKESSSIAEEHLTKQEKLLPTPIIQSTDILLLARHNHTLDAVQKYIKKFNLPIHKLGTFLKQELEFIELYSNYIQSLLNDTETHLFDTKEQALAYLLDFAKNTRLPSRYQKLIKQANTPYDHADILYLIKLLLKSLPNSGAINLSTIHQAKGLEFDATILLDATLSHYKDISNSIESKNLLYVAMSRHKKQLITFYKPEFLEQFGINKIQLAKYIKFLDNPVIRIPKQQKLF